MEGPLSSSEALLRATAANHRAWFRRTAAAVGGTARRLPGLDVVVAGRWGTIGFPHSRSRERLDEALRWAHSHGARAMSCWSLREDRVLGTLLLARGFEWGWQPHWMALELARLPGEEPAHGVVPRRGELPSDLPYADGPPDPPAVRHLVVRDGGQAVGHVVVNPWRGTAGIYDMGVAPGHRRRGIGRALTLAACRAGRDLGCTHAVLNATGEGEPLYRGVGFVSLGLGQTWWMHPGPRPTRRQTELVEAIGFGDVGRLAALRPSGNELGRSIPGAGPPLAAAVVTGQAAVADWILGRRPDLVSAPVELRGGTLLHVAVEWDDEAMLDVALSHGADRDARDRRWNATALQWAEHFGHERLAARLRD
jgi:ribosomal protein S18 acetylase RimI-like enzyme